MGARDLRFDDGRIRCAAEFVDVGARNEAARFGRPNDEPCGALAFKRGQDRVEFGQHVGRKRVGACTFAIEQQPGDAVSIAGQLQISIGAVCLGPGSEFDHAIGENVQDLAFHGVLYTVSINMAPPSPPPMHSVAIPRLVPSRFIALTRCRTIRLPLVPTGWPRLMAPPSTFNLAWSICPAAPSRPRTSRQNFSSFQAARHPSTWVANASFNSQVSISDKDNPLRFSSSVADITGPSPMIDGSSAAQWLSTMTALGVRPCFVTAASEATMTQDAPSVIWE